MENVEKTQKMLKQAKPDSQFQCERSGKDVGQFRPALCSSRMKPWELFLSGSRPCALLASEAANAQASWCHDDATLAIQVPEEVPQAASAGL